MSLLRVHDLRVSLPTDNGPAEALRGVDLMLDRGETLGIVGESGCGKSMTALALMGLLPEGAIRSGEVWFDDEPLHVLDEDRLCGIRGARIAMVFQEPMTSLNPLHRVGWQIAEGVRVHRAVTRSEALDEAGYWLDRVGIPDARERLGDYPHQFSGGQRQRVMIAMALANGPDLLVADEPTTALDVTVQKQILALIAELVEDLGMGLLLISHDLGVVAQTTQRTAVMYGGSVVEEGDTHAILRRPAHPYTRGLIASLPRIGLRGRLEAIPGSVPALGELPPGCPFAGRCREARPDCERSAPALIRLNAHHGARCVLLSESADG